MKGKTLSRLAVLFGLCAFWPFAFVAHGSESYVLVKKWGTQGSGDGEFNLPVGIAVESSGNVYVADQGNHRIQKFRPSFPVHRLGYGTAGLTVVWTSWPGESYKIWQSPDLAAWLAVPTTVESQGDSTSWTDDAASPLRQRFYRIELLP